MKATFIIFSILLLSLSSCFQKKEDETNSTSSWAQEIETQTGSTREEQWETAWTGSSQDSQEDQTSQDESSSVEGNSENVSWENTHSTQIDTNNSGEASTQQQEIVDEYKDDIEALIGDVFKSE